MVLAYVIKCGVCRGEQIGPLTNSCLKSVLLCFPCFLLLDCISAPSLFFLLRFQWSGLRGAAGECSRGETGPTGLPVRCASVHTRGYLVSSLPQLVMMGRRQNVLRRRFGLWRQAASAAADVERAVARSWGLRVLRAAMQRIPLSYDRLQDVAPG